ncbi:sporulation related protein [Ciceribacter lividus]|uniref:Sporulation related protein n=1 Tax=Ciceribacter lividus TaxID=1197950 RepID=A0A6I7HLF6_9HYPH|nr:SPOR domain-containing protein [Ciceribacter lividus]RCW24728.1 sporulation related protein [Ciceribacter lividus]
MVQKQAAYNSRLGGEDFADDDPLAELARIVGFEPPAARDVPREPQMVESPVAPVLPVAEPSSLEDELLREFENYERGQPVAAPESEPAYVAPEIVETVPVLDAIDEREELELNTAGANEAVLAEAEETFLNAEQAIMPEAAETISSDLADELEMAVSAGPVEPVWPRADAEPRLKLPLANFHVAQRPAPRLEPAFTAEREEPTTVEVEEAPRLSPVETSSWMSGPGSQSIERATVEGEAQHPSDPDFEVFSAGAESYSAPAVTMPESTPVSAGPATRTEPDFSFSFADELAADEDRFEPASEAVAEPAAPPAEPARAQSAAIDEDAFDPFADGAFELDLDDIELDFSDLEIDPEPAQVAKAESLHDEPVAAKAPSVPVEVARSVATAAPAAAPLPASVAAPAFASPVIHEDEELPFDLSEIAEQDESPESIAALDVPEIPVHEPREPVVARHDYDLDIDTELASLLSDAVVPAAASPAAQPAPAAAAPAATAAAPAAIADDFEAFEKALEQDLKRSYEGDKGFAGAVNRIPLQPSPEEIDYDEPRPSRGRLLAASAAGVLVLLAGGGLYAWMTGSDSVVLGSGEPVVIVADKEPVKVVPEDKGGKTVPNQDKAVYDRVAGAAVEDPKQPSLISSSEEPVDVVQKTLIPETLPLEGENEPDAMPTPVGETEDPRLLPSDQPANQQAAGSTSDPVTIAPRKVRTMIVRPDGTLVAQEVEQPTTEAAAPSAPVAPALAPPTTAPAEQASAAPATPTDTASPQTVAEPAAPATAQPANAGATTPAAETAAVPAEPARVETAAAPAVSAPVPTARPAEQPVNIVSTVTERGNVKPVETETASSSVPAGSYVIQIASLPSEADAQKSYKNLSAKFGNVIGGRAYEIKKAEIAGKGTYYRLRIVGGSKDEAVALCERYRAAGGTCLVAK